MGSSGESGCIDSSVGTLVWVRRRNGSWWPGRVVGPDELIEETVVAPRNGTPVKLLGRDDVQVDWYSLEKSKRVKAFRCGEYDGFIEKAKAAAANPNKRASKYARRDDAIIEALEIENECLAKDSVNISSHMSDSGDDHDCSASKSPTTSHSGEENEEMTDDGRRSRTPNDSEEDGTEGGVKRMRVLQDLGMGVVSKRSGLSENFQHNDASVLDTNIQSGIPNGSLANGSRYSSSLRKRKSQVPAANEYVKRRTRSRPLIKVLESTEMVSIPVAGDQLPNSSGSYLQSSDGKVPELEPNELKRVSDVDHIDQGNSPVLAPCSSGRPDIVAAGRKSSGGSLAEAESLRYVAVHDLCQSLELCSLQWQSKGKRNSRQTSRDRKFNPRKYMNVGDLLGIGNRDVLCHDSDQKRNCNGINGSATFDYALQGKSSHFVELSDGPIQRSLPYRQSRFMVPARYQTSDSIARNASLYDVKVEIKAKYQPQHVPMVSLTSRLNGKAIVGHTVTVKALDDGYSDKLFDGMECDLSVGKIDYAVHQDADNEKISAMHLDAPKNFARTKKSGLLQKKTRKLSSLTGHRRSEERKLPVEKSSNLAAALNLLSRVQLPCRNLLTLHCRRKSSWSMEYAFQEASTRVNINKPQSRPPSQTHSGTLSPPPFSGRSHAGVRFSQEPNNLLNLHSYKQSGLANKKTVTIQPGKDGSVVLATTKTRKQNKPAALLHKSVLKKDFRRMANAVNNQVVKNFYRADLKHAAFARLSVVHKSLRVAKSGPKKRNRQAVRIYGRK